MYEELIPNRLSQLRNQKNVSARDMSLSLGQNPGYINNIETGKALPSMTGFFYICDYLGISPSDFFDTKMIYPVELIELTDKLKMLNNQQLYCINLLTDELLK